jgi:hypothetical protein
MTLQPQNSKTVCFEVTVCPYHSNIASLEVTDTINFHKKYFYELPFGTEGLLHELGKGPPAELPTEI